MNATMGVLRECQNCGRSNNTFVNPDHCCNCRAKWGDGA